MIKIKRLGHLLLRVSNLPASLAFYCDLLGFELVEQGDEQHRRTAFLSLGEDGHNVDLVEVAPSALAHASQSSLHHFALQVQSFEDLRDAYFHLIDRNVEVIRATDHVSQKSIFTRDPDGNIVEIYYELPQALSIFRAGRADTDTPLVFER
ncbi:MAG: VOC family protein [Hahellaceae bacterium]|nr:VOC family protein [Hahellaceae bacterium]MCP5170173.1 VOC family protein [Hahellaceae bacterium]